MAAIEVPPAPENSAEQIAEEIAALRASFAAAHGTRVRFVISTYPDALGPLKGGPLSYTLDSADPEKFKAIVDDMQQRAREPIAKLLPSTLVIGQNYATEKLAALYRKFGIDATANFVALDPVRAPLYALALAGKDLKPWFEDPPEEQARQLAAFLQAQRADFRDKFTLILPKEWSRAALWTRRRFEGLRLIVNEKLTPRQFHKATDPFQDRVFLVVQRKGEAHPDAAAIAALHKAGYPMADITFNATEPLSRYMSLMTSTAQALQLSPETLDAADLPADPRSALGSLKAETPETLAHAINYGAKSRTFTCAEIVFFGDLGRLPAVKKTLETGARLLFRTPLKMPAGVFEGPADVMLGPAGCFTLLAMSATQNRFALAAFEPDRNMAEFLAVKLALERKRRLVRAILVEDLSIESVAGLEEFFSRTANNINGEIQSR